LIQSANRLGSQGLRGAAETTTAQVANGVHEARTFRGKPRRTLVGLP
jgi:hypothetical protein